MCSSDLTTTQTEVRTQNAEARKTTAAALEALGYHVLPSETNFFMVDIRREVVPVIGAFRARGIAVGRPFPPMTKHLRVSIGTAAEMSQFLDCFADLMRSAKTATGDPHA